MFLGEIGRESQTGHNLVTTPANPLRSAPKMAMGSTRRTCSRVDEVSRWYRFMYKLGLHPWEDDTESQLTQLRSLLKRIEDGCDSPRRTALDLGCGTGRYSIELAKRGWDVVGVDVVPKAVELAASERPPGERHGQVLRRGRYRPRTCRSRRRLSAVPRCRVLQPSERRSTDRLRSRRGRCRRA